MIDQETIFGSVRHKKDFLHDKAYQIRLTEMSWIDGFDCLILWSLSQPTTSQVQSRISRVHFPVLVLIGYIFLHLEGIRVGREGNAQFSPWDMWIHQTYF